MKATRIYQHRTEACAYYHKLGKTISIECGSSTRAADVAHTLRQADPSYEECLQLREKYKHPQ